MSGNNLVLAGSGGGPPPPTNLAAISITPTQFTLTWDASSIASVTFKVYKAGVEVVGATSNTGSVISGLTGNTIYAMKVRAYLGTAYTDSAVYNALTTPNAPTGVAFSGSTQTSFIISWTNVSGLTYSIYKDATLITGVTPTYTGTTINSSTNLSPVSNSSYNMYVYATNASGSTPSAVLVAWTIPDAPVYVSTALVRSRSARLNFTGNGGTYTAWVGSTQVGTDIAVITLASVTITSTTGNFACGGTGDPTNNTFYVGSKVIISGTSPGTISGYANPTTYYIIGGTSSSTFQLSTSIGGTAITTTNAGSTSGLTFTYVASGITMSTISIDNSTDGRFTGTNTVRYTYSPGDMVYVYGTSPGTITGYTNPKTYYMISASSGSSQFQLSATLSGNPITTVASGSTSGLTFVYLPKKISSLSAIGITDLLPSADNTVYIKASNLGGIASSAALTVRTQPDPPSSIVVEPNNTCTYLLFTTPTDSYGVICAYKLSAYTGTTNTCDGGTSSDWSYSKTTVTTVSPVCINNLTNNQGYYYTLATITTTGNSNETGPSTIGTPTVKTINVGGSTNLSISNSVLCSTYSWDGVKAIDFCIGTNSKIVSAGSTTPSLTIAVTMPARKKFTLYNYGFIVGFGGCGGNGTNARYNAAYNNHHSGCPGGPGLCVSTGAITIYNWCSILGGGGGGGGGDGWHGGGGGGGAGTGRQGNYYPGGGAGRAAYKTSGVYAGSTAGTSGTASSYSSYGYFTAGNGGKGGYGRATGSGVNGGSPGCNGTCANTNSCDTFTTSTNAGSGGAKGGACSTGGYGGGGGGGGGKNGGAGGTAGTTRGQTTAGGGPAGGAGGTAVTGNSFITWGTKGTRGGSVA
jgi:hypothetical protein